MLNTSLEDFKKNGENLNKTLKKMAAEDIDTMDQQTFETIQAVLGFMKASTELIAEQTKAIDEMNNKLDKLLKEKDIKPSLLFSNLG